MKVLRFFLDLKFDIFPPLHENQDLFFHVFKEEINQTSNKEKRHDTMYNFQKKQKKKCYLGHSDGEKAIVGVNNLKIL